ncbi:MAG TPA: hypothetical protein VHI52_21875 [Verrucomicrobiae bacterium]|nr:hypothetical protein [Verrucomicrobiae bacterium]
MFGGTLFLLANFIGVNALWKKQAQLRMQVAQLRDDRLIAQSLLSQKAMWEEREKYLDATQQHMKSADANAELMDMLTASAGKHAIVVISTVFTEPDASHKADYQQIAVKLTVSGAQKDITEWLWEIQQPDKFQAIPALSMRIGADPSKILCDLTVARYYAPAR